MILKRLQLTIPRIIQLLPINLIQQPLPLYLVQQAVKLLFMAVWISYQMENLVLLHLYLPPLPHILIKK